MVRKFSGSLDDMQRTAALVHRKTRDSIGVNKNNKKSKPKVFSLFFFPPMKFSVWLGCRRFGCKHFRVAGACLSVVLERFSTN